MGSSGLGVRPRTISLVTVLATDHPTSTEGHLEPPSTVDLQIEHLEKKLLREFGQLLDPHDLHRLIESALGQFSEARVRHFVPVLVERLVRNELNASPSRRRAASGCLTKQRAEPEA